MAEDVQRTLGRIEGKLDDALRRSEIHDTTISNHNDRIGSLEKWQSRLLGGAAVIGIVMGLLLKFIK